MKVIQRFVTEVKKVKEKFFVQTPALPQNIVPTALRSADSSNASSSNKTEVCSSTIQETVKLAIEEQSPTLVIKKCNLGDQDAIGLASILKDNQTFEELDLSENNIGPKGAQAIIKALETTNIKRLYFNNNHIFEDQGAAVMAALESNHLKEMRIKDNGVENNSDIWFTVKGLLAMSWPTTPVSANNKNSDSNDNILLLMPQELPTLSNHRINIALFRPLTPDIFPENLVVQSSGDVLDQNDL
jgi:hypothetical protein